MCRVITENIIMIELFLKWRKLEKGKSEGNKKKMTSRFPLEEKSYFGP